MKSFDNSLRNKQLLQLKCQKKKRIVESGKSWFEEVISKGVQAITYMVKVLERVRGIEEMLHDLITSLSQEVDILKEILNDWDEVAKSDLDAMVTCDVLPSCEMFYGCQGLMGYKEETLRKLITNLQGSLGDCQAIETGNMCGL